MAGLPQALTQKQSIPQTYIAQQAAIVATQKTAEQARLLAQQQTAAETDYYKTTVLTQLPSDLKTWAEQQYQQTGKYPSIDSTNAKIDNYNQVQQETYNKAQSDYNAQISAQKAAQQEAISAQAKAQEVINKSNSQKAQAKSDYVNGLVNANYKSTVLPYLDSKTALWAEQQYQQTGKYPTANSTQAQYMSNNNLTFKRNEGGDAYLYTNPNGLQYYSIGSAYIAGSYSQPTSYNPIVRQSKYEADVYSKKYSQFDYYGSEQVKLTGDPAVDQYIAQYNQGKQMQTNTQIQADTAAYNQVLAQKQANMVVQRQPEEQVMGSVAEQIGGNGNPFKSGSKDWYNYELGYRETSAQINKLPQTISPILTTSSLRSGSGTAAILGSSYAQQYTFPQPALAKGTSDGNPYNANIPEQKADWYNYELGYRETSAKVNKLSNVTTDKTNSTVKSGSGAAALLGSSYAQQYTIPQPALSVVNQPLMSDRVKAAGAKLTEAQARAIDLGYDWSSSASKEFFAAQDKALAAEKAQWNRDPITGLYFNVQTITSLPKNTSTVYSPSEQSLALSNILSPNDPTGSVLRGVSDFLFPGSKTITSETKTITKQGITTNQYQNVEKVPSGLESITGRPKENDVTSKDWFGFGGVALGATALSQSWGESVNKPTTLAYDTIKSSPLPQPVKGYLNAVTGFGSTIASTPSFLLNIPVAAVWATKNPLSVPSKAISINTDMLSSIVSREMESPGSGAGTALGMYVSGKGIDKGMAYTKLGIDYTSPVGIGVSKIPSRSGAESSILYGYTKPAFSFPETVNVRGTVGVPALSWADLVTSTKTYEKPTGAKFTKDIPTFKNVAEAKSFYTESAKAEGTFYHGTNDASFINNLIKDGSVKVGDKAPLYFGNKNTVYNRFMLGSETKGLPGSSSLLRIVETPKSLSETSLFKGKSTNPELSPGLYPGTKALSGVKYKGQLQNEYIIPKGTQLTVKDISYTEVGGARIPVIDIAIGKASALDTIINNIKKTDVTVRNVGKATKNIQSGWGEPTGFLSKLDMKMTNPLAENVAGTWTTGQKSLLYPYIEKISKVEGASAELKAVASAIKAKQAIKGITFVQRSPVFTEVIEKGILPKEAYVKLLKVRQDLGTNVVGGGSTSIKGQLGKSFFGKEILGDMDTWAEPKYVKQIAERDLAIIKQYRKDAYIETKRFKGQDNYEIMVPGVKKPITEVHSMDSWPWLREKGFIETVPGIGGTKQRVLSTEKLFIRKLSAAFENQRKNVENPLIQKPGQLIKFKYDITNVKHAVGAAAIAREASSLMYGRDVSKTGMTPSFRKGYDLENFSSAMDKMLETAKGKTKTEIKEYQNALEQNPLLLKETKQAKASSYAKQNPLIATRLLSENYGYKLKSKPYITSGTRRLEQPSQTKSIIYGVLSGNQTIKSSTTKPTYSTQQKQESNKIDRYYPTYSPQATKEVLRSTTYPVSTNKPVPVKTTTYQVSTNKPVPVKTTQYTVSINKPVPVKTTTYPVSTNKPVSLKTTLYPPFTPNTPNKTPSYPNTPPPTKPPNYPIIPPPTKPPNKTTTQINKNKYTPEIYKLIKEEPIKRRKKKIKRVTPKWWEYGYGATPTETSSFVLGSGYAEPTKTTKHKPIIKQKSKKRNKSGVSWVDIALHNT